MFSVSDNIWFTFHDTQFLDICSPEERKRSVRPLNVFFPVIAVSLT